MTPEDRYHFEPMVGLVESAIGRGESVGQYHHSEVLRLLRAALAEAAPPSGALDVERLRGMTDFWPNDEDHRWCDEDSGGGHRFDSAAWAQDFAAEYARLTPEPTDDREATR
jgi:hypothetical protein